MRNKFHFIFFIFLAVVVLYFLVDRMVIRHEDILNTRFLDQRFIELVERLIEENVFKIHEGRIILDEDALKNKRLGERTEARLKKSLAFLYLKQGNVYFDKMAVSVASKISKEEKVLRGRFLDRNGDVLAHSTIKGDKRISGQERHYAYGPEFYPVIGHANFIFGKRNLEKIMDAYLGEKRYFPAYKTISDMGKPLEVGNDVVLTLDSRVQRLAYNLMKGRRGAVVVLDVKTGEILGAVSAPSIDPNMKEWISWRESFRDHVGRSYENRAFAALYPPGSTFKAVVASAWIEEDVGGSGEKEFQIDCNGQKNRYRISDIHPHGKVDFNKAFRESCNLFFSEVGVALGEKLLDYATRFGFNRDLDLMAGMKDYHYKSEKSLAFSWFDGNNGKSEMKTYKSIDFKRNPKIVAQGSIGQNLITATPLQMALVASTIANKGVLLNPVVIREIKTGDGKKNLFSSRPVENGRSIKETTAEKLKKLMVEVMEKGTGKDVKKIYFEDGRYTTAPNRKDNTSLPPFSKGGDACLPPGKGRLLDAKIVAVAGKTGTAEVGDKNGDGVINPNEKPHSWFIGFAPADNPKFAIAVVVENQGFGSLTAAPIAVEVLAEALNQH